MELLLAGTDREYLAQLTAIGQDCAVPLVASGDVHMHVRARRRLQDALTAIRHGVTLAQAGTRLYPNGERHLRERDPLGTAVSAAASGADAADCAALHLQFGRTAL